MTTGIACPSWCSAHLPDVPGLEHEPFHVHRVTIGQVSVNVEWRPEDEATGRVPVVELDDTQWVSGQDARDFAAAILIASDIIESAGSHEATPPTVS